MPPEAETEPPPSIGNDQLSLLIRVCERAQSTFSFADWRDIAVKEGENAEASRQRFNYMMHKLRAIDNHNKCKETENYTPAKPKKRGAPEPLDEDEEQMGNPEALKPTPNLVLRHGAKKPKPENGKE